jgi:hypothetical protein
MKTIKVFLSGVAVYFGVASLHACSGPDSLPTWATSSVSVGTGGAPGWASTATASTASGGGKGGAGGMMNPVPDALAESGSRLKAQWIVGDDGSKSFAGFYDSARKETCSFILMYDGTRRCIPFGAAVSSYAGHYTDAACSNLISATYVSTCFVTPTYAYSIPGDICTGAYKLYQVGPKFSPPVVYYVTNGSCKQAVPDPAYEYHLISAEIPPSAFVAATISTDA